MSLFEPITKEEFEESQTGLPHAQPAIAGGGSPESPKTSPCDFCGHCETPNNCAWSRQCPVCAAPAGKIDAFGTFHCKTPTGGVTGLHAERWCNT